MQHRSTRGRGRLGALAAALALAAILAGCAAAPGRLLLSDELGALAQAQVEAAAAPLIARGAQVAVLVVARGDATGADLQRRLGAAGLLERGAIAPDAIALYVSFEPRYSELRAGARWGRGLPDEALREVRTATLNPALREGRLAAGVAATLQALAARLAAPPLLQRVMDGLIYALVGGLLLAALAISPLGERLAGLWRRSPPGRLARWLGDQTPAGRRRVERIGRAARLRMEDRAEYARSWCRAAGSGKRRAEAAPLLERLRRLDQERAALLKGRPGRALATAMDELVCAYEALGREAERLAPARPQPRRRRKAAAGAAGLALTGGAAEPTGGSPGPYAGDSSPTWDGGSGDAGPSSDGGAW